MAIPLLPGSEEFHSASTQMFQQMIELEDRTCEALGKEQARIGNAPKADTSVSSSIAIVRSWRERVVQWFYDLIDHLGENRELTFIAMNILDRYTGCCCSPNERLYELQAMSALFLAVRIGGSGNLSLTQLVAMSRHSDLQEKDIVAMGKSMIAALVWDQRFLTPADFVRFFVSDIARTASLSSEQHGALLDSAMYLVELSVFDLSLARKRPSNIAAAATMAAVDRLQAAAAPSSSAAQQQLPQVIKADLASSVRSLTVSRFGDLSPLQRRLELLSRDARDKTSCSPHLIPDESEEETVPSMCSSTTELPMLLPMVSNSELSSL